MKTNKLKYDMPACNWIDGLAIGNGRLAAMAWQRKDEHVITLNHEWLWRGVNRERKPEQVAQYLPILRELLVNRDFFTATGFANLFFAGKGGCSGLPVGNDAYQVAGELVFKLNDTEKILTSELDIYNAVIETNTKTISGIVTSKYVASCKSGLILYEWLGNDTIFGGELYIDRISDDKAKYEYVVEKDMLVFKCQFDKGLKFNITANILTNGEVNIKSNRLIIENATQLKVILNIATEVKGIEAELREFNLEFKDFYNDINAHKQKFSDIMSRIDFQLEVQEDEITTDKRIKNLAEGKIDNLLTKQYFDFGRYLLISSNICGDLPANLQGKWNDSICPPWESDYHMDINLQMNYWFAEQADLGELSQKLINFLLKFRKSGAVAAKNMFGCRGILMPLQTDAWGISTPEAYGWATWIGVGAWFCQYFWWHYIYSGDMEYLKNSAYLYFTDVAEFYEDFLVEDENGIFQIMPSQSPENRFVGTGNFPVSICVSSAIDVQLAYDVFGYAIKSSEILGVDEEKRAKWKNMQSRLPEFKIGADGRLLEWNEEKEEVEPGHRHFAHLYGLHPSEIFTKEKMPAQYDACIKSLEYRVANGATTEGGWICAWVACFYARLGNKKGFAENLYKQLSSYTTRGLLDLYPPNIFQIEGNFGLTSAIFESIVSVTDNKIRLLNAVLPEWRSGHLTGVKLPGGHTISVWWKNEKLEKFELEFGFENTVTVIAEGKEIVICAKQGEKYVSDTRR